MEYLKNWLANNWIIIIALFVSVFAILIFYAGLNNYQLNYMLNSDIMYFPSVFIDIFKDHNTFNGWVIPGAPGFFPDMALYFLLMALTNNIPIAAFLFGVIQFLTILFLFSYLLNLIIGVKSQITYLYNALLLLLLIVNGFWGGDFQFTFHILSNTYHTGPFVCTLLSLIFIIKFFKTANRKYLIPMILIGAISIVSDKLFIIMFTIPMSAVLIFFINSTDKQKVRWSLGAVILQLVMGIGLFAFYEYLSPTFIRVYEPKEFLLERVVSSWQMLSGQLHGYLIRSIFSSIIIIFTAVSLIVLSCLFVYRYFIKRQYKSGGIQLYFILYIIVFLGFVFLTPVFLGDYNGIDKMRYNISVYYIGLLGISFIVFLIPVNKTGSIIRSIIPIVLLVLFIATLTVRWINIKDRQKLDRYFNYYPDQAMVVDTLCQKLELKNGVAMYWDSKKAWLFNRNKRKVYACLTSGYADTWIVCNREWFYKQPSDTNQLFNFVLFNSNEDTERLYQYFGQPLYQEQFGKYIIYKYPDFYYDKKTQGPIFIKK